jgi:hypothetical protein
MKYENAFDGLELSQKISVIETYIKRQQNVVIKTTNVKNCIYNILMPILEKNLNTFELFESFTDLDNFLQSNTNYRILNFSNISDVGKMTEILDLVTAPYIVIVGEFPNWYESTMLNLHEIQI